MSRKKRWLILAIPLIIISYLIGNVITIWQYSYENETRQADVAIILGAAATDDGVSPVFRERINHGIWLYENGYVNHLIITGGYGEGNQYSDAAIGKNYAVSHGVPAEAVLIEETSTITEENLENAKRLMDSSSYHTALIVSDPLHMKRAMRMAKDTRLDAYTSPTQTSMYRGSWTKAKFLAREVFFYIGYKIVSEAESLFS